jgi:hypothetical protein
VVTVELPFKVSLRSRGFEYHTEENLKWKEFITKIIDVIPLKFNITYLLMELSPS